MQQNKGLTIAEPSGKIGVLIPGLGAVSTTFIAGVFAVLKGLAKPIGSLTQLGTIRLGKRTEDRVPLIKDFAKLAEIEDLVFGGWDIFEDNCYQSAVNAGVLEQNLLDKVRPELERITPMKAVFDKNYVKKLDGTHVKTGASKYDLAMQLIDDCKRFKDENNLDRLVMIWCASTEIYLKKTETHE
ncbi:inositol-3-phosphate synthase, partial [candidate division KSB1 bacterium]